MISTDTFSTTASGEQIGPSQFAVVDTKTGRSGIQFCGVEHKPIIDVEDDDRPDDSYIVIGALASGDPIVLKKAEGQISIYNLEDDRIEDDETYEDFYAFLNDTYP